MFVTAIYSVFSGCSFLNSTSRTTHFIMLTTVRSSRRLAGKRKVSQIVDDLSEEEPPKKKQKITKKSAAAPKNKKTPKKRQEEREESEEDFSEEDAPKTNSKKKSANSDAESASGNDSEDSNDEADDWAVLKPRKRSDLEELKATALKKLLASADTSAYQSLGEEEYTLPDELILQIFSGLTRKQLHAVGLTCRQWLRLTNDHSLGWHLAHSVVVQENTRKYFEDIMKKKGTGGYDSWGIDVMSSEAKSATLQQYKKNFLQMTPGVPTAIQWEESTYDNTRIRLCDEDGNVVRYASTIDCNVKMNHHYSFTISWPELLKDTELWSYRIHQITAEEAAQLNGYEDYKNTDPVTDQWIVDIEINMKRLEELIAANETVPGMKLIYALVEVDFLQRLTALSSAKFSSLPRRSFTAQQQPEGFKNEIQLYKYQLDAISWMKSVEDNKDGLPYFTAYPWRRAKTELIFDLSQIRGTFYGGEGSVVTNLEEFVDVALPKGAVLADEMGLGKTMEMIGLILASPPPKKLPKHRALITSRATLVLCPNHLVTQWSDELAKATKLKVAVAATIVQLRQFTYQDFIDYDVVIASYQLLENPKYFFLESTEKKRSSIRNHEEAERSEWVESSLEALKRSKQGFAKKCPILEHFYWHRLVLDEGHEYLAKPYFNYLISTCFSKFAWYVTGTPFPTHQHFKYVKRFIGVQSNFKEYPMQQETLLTDLMLRDLYWRHTKVSVQGEYKIPTYVEDLVLVEFDEIEKALYADERKEADQSHLCGSLLQKSTLDERLAQLLAKKKNDILSSETRHVPNATNSLAGAQRFYDNETDLMKKAVALTVLENRKRELIEAKELLEHHKKVLEAAHKVTPFAKRDKKKSNELTTLIEQHGTKLVQMIVYLKKLFERKPDSRVIFFSQFEDTLTNVSQILTDYQIPNVFVEGNIWKRTKAITNFKNDEDVKVIMLSLKNAASGTNLVEATHVILMDPVTGSKKEAQAIESQAIGRAFRQGQTKQITIVRFVVKNTIEHALYLRNNDVNEDATVVVTKDNKPQLVRSTSSVMLKRSGSVGNLLEVNNNNNNATH